MWIETRGRQHRVYWRTGQASPKKTFEPFASRDAAELFVTRPSAGCYQPDGRVHLDWEVHESTVAGAHWGNRLLACSDPALTSSKRSACGPRR